MEQFKSKMCLSSYRYLKFTNGISLKLDKLSTHREKEKFEKLTSHHVLLSKAPTSPYIPTLRKFRKIKAETWYGSELRLIPFNRQAVHKEA